MDKIFDIVLYEDEKELLNYLKAHPLSINARDTEGCTPLFWANSKQAEVLIDKGIDIYARTNHGRTPLHLFFSSYGRDFKDYAAMCETLIAAGLDVNSIDKFKCNPLHYHVNTVGNPDKRDFARVLINRHCDVNHQNKLGNTLAHETSDYFTLRMLIECGADIEIKNNDGYSVLPDRV